MAEAFYNSTAWRKLRIQALRRDHYLCQACLRGHRITTATEVHHLQPVKKAPSLSLRLENLESLCWDCHEETKHQKPERRVAARVIKI